MQSSDIRKQFIDFFIDKNHHFVRSSSLVPLDDPTLLFTNAGMNQFKDIFLGNVKPKYNRAVNSQKCIRVSGKHNDLEEVGVDNYHHTFFEMLGNWSFGDYYKEESINWAWELFTKHWKLDKNRLWITVYQDDNESYHIWNQIKDLDSDRILKFGDKDNFWEMGDVGPCGPCSEIHYYTGSNPQGQIEEGVNKDNDYRELWNLVFIQYNRETDGTLNDLPLKHVDTGLGLERITSVINNTTDHYSTDLFKPLIDKITNISKIPYNDKKGTPHRVISDHLRMLSFSIADGVLPSNEGRGYVLRRVLRRAVRYGDLLGIKDLFLGRLVSDLIPIVNSYYPEIKSKKDHIEKTLNAEEALFRKTLEKGLFKFDEILNKNKRSKSFSGNDIFKLYDTYGFPVDLTKLLCKEKGISVDILEFKKLMKEQQNKARSSRKFNLKDKKIIWNIVSKESSKFVGYNEYSSKSQITSYCMDSDIIYIQLNKTPFYFESGGQVADTGKIYNKKFTLTVLDVQKVDEKICHIAKLSKGTFNGKLLDVISKIDVNKRIDIMSNHTATHLLHKSLINILGAHVQQAGSLVDNNRLRFDFTYNEKLTKEQIIQIENSINTQINDRIDIDIQNIDYNSAIKGGALALFSEKYEDNVRVVDIPGFSKELCGGTHVKNTLDIGFFKIISEKSLSSGIRRIEALTSSGCYEYLSTNNDILFNMSRTLKCSINEALTTLDALKKQNELLVAENKELKLANQSKKILDLLEKSIDYNGIRIVFKILNEPLDINILSDQFRAEVKENGIMVLGLIQNEQPMVICSITDNLTSRYDARVIVKEGAKYIEGGGGGRKHFAKAGGKNKDNLEIAIDKIRKMIIND